MRNKKSLWMSIILVVVIIIGASVAVAYVYNNYIDKIDENPTIIDQTFENLEVTNVTKEVENKLLSYIDPSYYRGQIVRENTLNETVKLQMAVKYLFMYKTPNTFIPTCTQIKNASGLIDLERQIAEDAICNEMGSEAYLNQDDFKVMDLKFYEVSKSDVTGAYYDIFRILTNRVHQTITVDTYTCEYKEDNYLCYSVLKDKSNKRVLHNVYKFQKNDTALVMYEQVLFKDEFGYNTDYKYFNQVMDLASAEAIKKQQGFTTEDELDRYLLDKHGVVFQHLFLKNSENQYYWHGTQKYDEKLDDANKNTIKNENEA